MVTQPVPKMSLLTVEDLEQIESDERFELIRGEFDAVPPAGFEHSSRAARIVGFVQIYLLDNPIGVVATEGAGFLIARDPDVLVVPDVSFVRNDRLPSVSERRGFLRLVPDLVIEIISPSDRASRINDKVMLYLEAGAKLVWVVDADRRIVMVYRAADASTARILREGDELDGEDVLPGFRLPVSQIFA